MAPTQSTQVHLATYPQQPSSAATTDIELLQENDHSQPNSDNGFSLPSTDGGKDAWLCLFSCFMLEAMIWGFPSSYGVFQEYYATSEEFSGQSNVAVVGTCAMVCYSSCSETKTNTYPGHHVHGHCNMVRRTKVLSQVSYLGHTSWISSCLPCLGPWISFHERNAPHNYPRHLIRTGRRSRMDANPLQYRRVVGTQKRFCLRSYHGRPRVEWGYSASHTRMASAFLRIPDDSTSMRTQLCGPQLPHRLFLQTSPSTISNIAIQRIRLVFLDLFELSHSAIRQHHPEPWILPTSHLPTHFRSVYWCR